MTARIWKFVYAPTVFQRFLFIAILSTSHFWLNLVQAALEKDLLASNESRFQRIPDTQSNLSFEYLQEFYKFIQQKSLLPSTLMYLAVESMSATLSVLLLSSIAFAIGGVIVDAEKQLDSELRSSNYRKDDTHFLAYPAAYICVLPLIMMLMELTENALQMIVLFVSAPSLLRWIVLIARIKSPLARLLFSLSSMTILVSVLRIFLQGLKMGDAFLAFRSKQPNLQGLVPASSLIQAEKEAKNTQETRKSNWNQNNKKKLKKK